MMLLIQHSCIKLLDLGMIKIILLYHLYCIIVMLDDFAGAAVFLSVCGEANS